MTFAIFRPSIYLVSVLAMMVVIGTGSAGVLNQTLSLGTLFIFITYISSFFDPIQELAEQFGTLQSSLASAGKIFSILDEKPDIVKPTHPVEVNIKATHRIPSCMVRLREGRLYFKRHQFRHRTGRKSCICRCYRSWKIFHLKSDRTIL